MKHPNADLEHVYTNPTTGVRITVKSVGKDTLRCTYLTPRPETHDNPDFLTTPEMFRRDIRWGVWERDKTPPCAGHDGAG